MRAILDMAIKELRLLWRDKGGMFWALGFPMIMAVVFALMFGGMGSGGRGSMRILVVDEANTEASAQYIAKLSAQDALTVQTMPEAEATDEVRRGKAVAFVVIQPGFGEDLQALFGGELPLEIGIDPSRKAESGLLQGMLIQSTFELLFERFQNPDWLRSEIRKGIVPTDQLSGVDAVQGMLLNSMLGSVETYLGQVDEEFYRRGFGGAGTEAETGEETASGGGGFGMNIPSRSVTRDQTGQPRSAFDITFPSAILWGMMGCVLVFSISIVTERTGGTYLRLRIAPIGPADILLGKGLACFLACATVIIILLLLGILVFRVRVGNPFILVTAALCVAVCFTGVMIFISVLGKTEAAVSGSGTAIFLVWMMFGGGMMPLAFMPGWMRSVSNVSPVKWGVYALEGGIWRDLAFSEVVLPCAVLLAVGAVLFVIGWTILMKRDV